MINHRARKLLAHWARRTMDKVDLTLGLEEGSMHCFTPKILSICYASIREASHDLYKPTLVKKMQLVRGPWEDSTTENYSVKPHTKHLLAASKRLSGFTSRGFSKSRCEMMEMKRWCAMFRYLSACRVYIRSCLASPESESVGMYLWDSKVQEGSINQRSTPT